MTKRLLLNVSVYCLLTFPTTHSALRAEKILGEQGMNFIIVPTPREISEGCGLAIKCHSEDLSDIVQKLNNGGIELKDFFQVEKQPEKNKITRISGNAGKNH